MTIDIKTLFSSSTISQWYQAGLELFAALKIAITSWRDGDPTLSTLYFLAESLAARDETAELYVKSGFLSTAEGNWKRLHASEVYGIDSDPATYATASVVVQNTEGGYYPLEAGDVVFKSSASNKTYHSTNAVELTAGSTKTFTVEADELGSDSSAEVDEIDMIISPALIGCSVVSSTEAIGEDAQSLESLETECNDSLGALSPNGPSDAYRSVATKYELTGTREITRAESVTTASGFVTVYLAGVDGAVDVWVPALAQTAIDLWATPQGFTATAALAVNRSIDVTAAVYGHNLPANFDALGLSALTVLIPTKAISKHNSIVANGHVKVTLEELRAAIHAKLVEAGATDVGVTLSAPAADVDLLLGEVAVLGAVVITEAT